MSLTQITNHVHVCAFTFLTEEQLKLKLKLSTTTTTTDGNAEREHKVKLLRCGKCHGVWYKDRESQMAHWRFHKHFCTPIDRDPSMQAYRDAAGAQSDEMDVLTCLIIIMTILKGIERGNYSNTGPWLLAFALQEFYRHMNGEEAIAVNKSTKLFCRKSSSKLL